MKKIYQVGPLDSPIALLRVDDVEGTVWSERQLSVNTVEKMRMFRNGSRQRKFLPYVWVIMARVPLMEHSQFTPLCLRHQTHGFCRSTSSTIPSREQQ